MNLLVAALSEEGVDQPHAVLAAPARWLDDDARRVRDRRLRAELTDEIRSAASILARPMAECYGWVSTATCETALLAAAGKNQAVLVTRTGDTASLEPISPDGLVEAVAKRLPDTPPGHGRALNVATNDLAPGARPSTDVRMLRTLMARPRTASGQLHVATRDRLNRRRRSPNPLIYLDIADGRWMTRATPDGWVHAAPATVQLIATTLGRMRRQLG